MTKFNKNAEYPPFIEWEWKSYDGQKTIDLKEFMEKHRDSEIFVGTDSQNYRKKEKRCVFTTVIIAYKRGKGGNVIMHSDKTGYIDALRQRLLLEAMRSLETAWFIGPLIKKETVVTIHLDVNSNLKYKSSQYKDELVGLVMAQGFNCIHKPNAWAASSCADSRC